MQIMQRMLGKPTVHRMLEKQGMQKGIICKKIERMQKKQKMQKMQKCRTCKRR